MKRFVLAMILATVIGLVGFAQGTVIVDATVRDITVTKAGELKDKLGEDMNFVTKLTVRGPINDEDFNTMWSASFYGKLTDIDLEKATVESGIVPAGAFCHLEVQAIINGGSLPFLSTKLRSIVLPEGITEIGNVAFMFSHYLESINFPSTLKKLGSNCFTECANINLSSLRLNEGLEIIGAYCFYSLYTHREDYSDINNTLTIPNSVKIIETEAFCNSLIYKVNMPADLEFLGERAFAYNRLTEVKFVNPIINFEGKEQFYNNPVKEVSFAEGTKTIPGDMFNDSAAGMKVNMPETVEWIGDNAFAGAAYTPLHEGVRFIGTMNLEWCRQPEYVVFPSTLEYIFLINFGDWTGIKSIYLKAKVPPIRIEVNSEQYAILANSENDDKPIFPAKETVIYVPVGTADLYRNSHWNHFPNIVETDEFPTTGIDAVHNANADSGDIYDLNGRKVEHPLPGNIYIKAGEKFICK